MSVLLKIAESGLLRWLLDRWFPYHSFREGKAPPPSFRPAEPSNVAAAFWLLLFGWVAAILVSVAESVHGATCKRSNVATTAAPLAKSCGDNGCPCRIHLLEERRLQ